MSFAKIDISLKIRNNVSYPVPINVLGNSFNLLDTSNQTTEYRYDLTGFVFGSENQVLIEYKRVGEPTFQIYSGIFATTQQEQTLENVLNVLNNLGIGSFQLYEQGGNTYIGTYNDNYVFGNLEINTNVNLVSPSFSTGTGFDAPVTNLVTQSDGKVVYVGNFTQYNGQAVSGFIVRLNTDGSIDTTFNVGGTGFDAAPVSITTDFQNPQHILCAGPFTTFNGVARNGVARLLLTGALDTSFVVGTGITAGTINVISMYNDNNSIQKILLAGTSNMVYNGTAGSLIRIKNNGGIDATFTTGIVTGANPTPQILDIALTNNSGSGDIIIVGDFDQYTGSGLIGFGIARINKDGTFDSGLSTGTGFNGVPEAVQVQNNQQILVGGNFTSYNGNAAGYFIRLNTDGSVESVFGSGFNGSVTDIAALTIIDDYKILVSGNFTTFTNGVVTNCDGLVRINLDGTANAIWYNGTGFGGTGTGIFSLPADQSVVNIGGSFTLYNGTLNNYVIQLSQIIF